ncbi:MAG: hypothetical protein K2N87_09880 [Eubacterium sp.]|nr:hypothetical protein [Eubacterium sp.]
MKKYVEIFTGCLCAAALFLCFSICGCGSRQGGAENSQGQASIYDAPLDILEKIIAAYEGNELFAMYGGDSEHAVMDAPGSFAVSNTQELDAVLGVPESQWQNLEEAASVVHMMNANTFTGAAYRLKDSTDQHAFAEAVKANLLKKQWVCGQPDTLLVIQADEKHMLTAFGDATLIQTFQNHALSVLKGSKVVIEAPVTG